MRVLNGALYGRLAPEREPPHAAGVEAGDQRGHEPDRPDDVRERVAPGERSAKDLLLGEEADERDDAHQRKAADEERDRGRAHLTPEPAVLAHVLLVVHRMDDVPRGHEKQGLEEGVCQHVEQAGGVRADADGKEHVADLAHRGVGQHALDVGLHEGDGGREKRRDCADDRDRAMGVNGHVVDGVHAPDEVDAGGDHGRGMDEGADRGRTLHGVRQPGVERDLGRLRDRAHEQQEGRELERGRLGDVEAGQLVENARVGERVVGDEQHERAEDHPDVADDVHDERLPSRDHS